MPANISRLMSRNSLLFRSNFGSMCALWTCSTSKMQITTATSLHDTKNESDATYNSNLFVKNNLAIMEMKQNTFLYMGLDRGYKPLPKSRVHLLPLLPESQDELPVRKMNRLMVKCIRKEVEEDQYEIFEVEALDRKSPYPLFNMTNELLHMLRDNDSLSKVIIPLKDDKELQEKYVGMTGSLRLGRLMEEMDSFAVWVAYKHILNPRQKPEDHSPYVIVTLLVDRITFTSFQPKHDANISLSGHVSWVGKSSIEVMVNAQQGVYGHWEEITSAVFLLAARNSTNEGPAFVNKLVPETDKERKIFLGGENRKKTRIQNQQGSLLKVVPNAEEQKVIHDLFLKTIDLKDPTIHRRVLPSGSMWMDDHIYSSIIHGHPEDRNMYDTIFGGFLMRNSLELAWMSACLYSKYYPKLLHISDISFRKPIHVGSFINMHAHVVYTERNYMQIVVFADVLDPTTNATITTNSFQYTFENPVKAYTILPRSYSDAMLYIDGRRHFQHVMDLIPKSKI